MTRYRKKPVEIEAMQYTQENRDEVIAWCGARHTGIDEDGAAYELENIKIKTLEGEMMARPGDWIIKGVQGEFYPCKPEIFEATYEPAGAPGPPATGAERIAVERLRQIHAEGWTAEHDDDWWRGELASAAIGYAYHAIVAGGSKHYRIHAPIDHGVIVWPWDPSWWKPSTPLRDLVKAGALIAAEIDRRLRAGETEEPAP